MRLVAAACCAAVLAAAGCGRDHGSAPPAPACTSGSGPLVEALAAAPARVRVDGVPISECLRPHPSRAGLQAVGESVVAAAQRLRDARRSVELGYLVGALRRGAGPVAGLYAELLRRVEQEAIPLARSARFRRGERAGRVHG